ncbi:hypothetical protein [Pseudomonas sp. PvP001]|uniref:KGGVGR-motif variant AAA ATPase n=1 Tax=Pseudomonas sp. PvP001 TaxID=3158559 RepID=UPI00339B15F7
MIRYDDALPLLVDILKNNMHEGFLENNVVYRDADGILSVVIRESVDCELLEKVEPLLSSVEGYISSPAFLTPDDLFDNDLKNKDLDDWELVRHEGKATYVRYVEKRIVGSDWVRGVIPNSLPDAPPIIVFASLKGGVGRSTALSVAAFDFANKGKNILAIDLDLEAPGIGSILLDNDNLPEFGALDYYVESGRSDISHEFITKLSEISYTCENGGSVHVIPAAGKRCRSHPENVIGKISRSYLETVEGENSKTFLDKTRDLIASACDNSQYDVVFIDARAGLNETTAATIQGLGADILFFGIDTPQTWEGYKYFLSHLARYKNRASLESDWRYKIKMIHAKALEGQSIGKAFRDNSFELFANYLYDELDGDEGAEGLPESFSFDLDDQSAPHYAWPIYMSEFFYEYNPQSSDKLPSDVINAIYGEFLTSLYDRVFSNGA